MGSSALYFSFLSVSCSFFTFARHPFIMLLRCAAEHTRSSVTGSFLVFGSFRRLVTRHTPHLYLFRSSVMGTIEPQQQHFEYFISRGFSSDFLRCFTPLLGFESSFCSLFFFLLFRLNNKSIAYWKVLLHINESRGFLFERCETLYIVLGYIWVQ